MNEEIIYDDAYKIPLHDLIRDTRPVTILDLKKVLNEGGYFGRIKIFRKKGYGSKSDKVKLSVYLPDSKLTYTWPYEGYISIPSPKVMLRKEVKIPTFLSRAMDIFLETIVVNTFILRERMNIIYDDAIKIIRFLADHNLLIKGAIFKIKTKEDLEEIKANYFQI